MTKPLRRRGPHLPTGACGAVTPIFGSNFGPIIPNHLNMPKVQIKGSKLVYKFVSGLDIK